MVRIPHTNDLELVSQEMCTQYVHEAKAGMSREKNEWKTEKWNQNCWIPKKKSTTEITSNWHKWKKEKQATQIDCSVKYWISYMKSAVLNSFWYRCALKFHSVCIGSNADDPMIRLPRIRGTGAIEKKKSRNTLENAHTFAFQMCIKFQNGAQWKLINNIYLKSYKCIYANAQWVVVARILLLFLCVIFILTSIWWFSALTLHNNHHNLYSKMPNSPSKFVDFWLILECSVYSVCWFLLETAKRKKTFQQDDERATEKIAVQNRSIFFSHSRSLNMFMRCAHHLCVCVGVLVRATYFNYC